jgi:hypothetical protein
VDDQKLGVSIKDFGFVVPMLWMGTALSWRGGRAFENDKIG